MSMAPRVVTPSRRVNEYTVVIDEGARDGLSEGDSVMLSVDGSDHLRATVVDVAETEAVLEINTV
ncbi:hypothetical protein [Haloarchaeobius iranensis]|uniref:Uncharacterized protein n=1 Tax=Haloarchaeobius iranensis TaxID=996166 RepID=A0A1G9Y642_9EURY|nr:hypothetical protein [Haloarchaeobius iranensis]SDN04031.1 hypothetical protein SAMN05192554_1132 [Haloarchaeobius iranensis]